MIASFPAYNAYAERVLMPTMDPAALTEIKQLETVKDYANPRYMELLMQHHYIHHVLRLPLGEWPDPVERTFKHINSKVYVPMQGPSELGGSGKLMQWDRTADLRRIGVQSLTIGARHDTMDPSHMEGMAAAWPLSGLSRRQPYGDVRRSTKVLCRLNRLSPKMSIASNRKPVPSDQANSAH
jgi:proline iminopeptidase